MILWVIYDIVDDKVRSKVASACLDYGLYRVQKSVFLGELDASERDSLALKCEELIDAEVDSVYVFPMDEKSFKKIKLIGQAFDRELVTDEIITKFF